MDWSEEDQKVAVSAASAMSLKSRSISSLDLAADARAPRARRSAQPSNKEGLEDPTLETPLKDTGLPPSPPAPPIDGLLHPSMKQYMARPDVKAKKAEYMKQYMARPDVKAKQAEYKKQYDARPEVKAKRAEYNTRPDVKAKKTEHNARPDVKAKQAEYRASPKGKAKRAEYCARPDVKAKQAEYKKTLIETVNVFKKDVRRFRTEYEQKGPIKDTIEY